MTALGHSAEDWEWEAIKSNDSDYDTIFGMLLGAPEFSAVPPVSLAFPKKKMA
ncbi:hypothetical protein ACVRXQ_07615 [Streptococcus panodentis]|uniref:hypothetical protein n=1 Tax=Streptococcus panodentis TaxID=1581472 RepID=UPI001AE2B116